VDVVKTPDGQLKVGDYRTFTQGGWGGPGNPGQLLATNFAKVYPGDSVEVGVVSGLGFSINLLDRTLCASTYQANSRTC